jgi:hypothetical protein
MDVNKKDLQIKSRVAQRERRLAVGSDQEDAGLGKRWSKPGWRFSQCGGSRPEELEPGHLDEDGRGNGGVDPGLGLSGGQRSLDPVLATTVCADGLNVRIRLIVAVAGRDFRARPSAEKPSSSDRRCKRHRGDE